MRKRNFKAVAVLTAAAMALAGCGSSQNSPATAAKTEEEAPSKAEGKDSETPAPATDFPTKAIDIVFPSSQAETLTYPAVSLQKSFPRNWDSL